MTKKLERCPWAPSNDPLYVRYHDEEWGVPVHDERRIYEFLVLETFQAGLSWRIVLKNFRRAFAGFDPTKVARFTAKDIGRLLSDTGIVRNRMKIEAAVNNAQRFVETAEEFGTFDRYMWSWVGGKPIVHRPRAMKDVLAFTDEAVAWSKDLKRRRFQFLGPTVVYAHMQATGMVNDHLSVCFRHKALAFKAR
jgi:DNA-3-methyladenine glycosylase I